jgi:hypothetical protein
MPATALRRAATLTGVLLVAHATTAGAASPPVTGQAMAADAAFLAYAPPPPNGAGALCLVDTGVNALPDTTPGLVSATALDGGTGTDVDPLGHGTVDAAIAGGAGHGVLGAWPRLKIVSIRATDIPSPGQEPSFEFDDYIKGIGQCTQPTPGVSVEAIDLPLQSIIQPSPDQTEAFAAAVAKAQAQGISILAAAGNKPGAIELPASEPGIFAVGGDQVSGNVYDPNPAGICSDSATTGLTFFSPGCGIDTIDPATDAPLCCGNGTSQASAFTAGVLVALRSYDRTLTADKAVQLLLSTTTGGHLDAAAAFRADGLGAIVDAGNAAIPATPPAPTPMQSAPTSSPATTTTQANTPAAPRVVPRPLVKSVTWRHGVLRIALKSIPRGAVLHVEVTFRGHTALYAATAHTVLTRHTGRPARAMLHLTEGTASSGTVSIRP